MRALSAALAVLLSIGAALCQDTAESHLGRGYDFLRQQRYTEAASEFRDALKVDSSLTMRARFPLAVALFELKRPDDARREFEAVRKEIGDHPNVDYYLGRLDLQAQNFAGAVRNLTNAAEKPPFPDTNYYLGFAYFKQGDLASAEKWLQKAAAVNPDDSNALYQLGLVYGRMGREEDAKTAMARSAQLRQRDVTESELRSECEKKLEQGPREEAHAVCQRLYDPNNADKLTALGTIYGKHGDLEASLAPLQRAAELEPHSPQTQYNLAFTYYRLNRLEDARKPLAQAIARWPDLFPLNWLYGAVLVKLGDDAEAYVALDRAHSLNPQDRANGQLLYVTTLVLARKSRDAHDYSRALRYFGEAAHLQPNDPEPHLGQAEVYRLMGQSAAAEVEQKRADLLKR